ncbi:MAG: hypothetical protein ABI867_25715 [Kofleriaceae bacterium]
MTKYVLIAVALAGCTDSKTAVTGTQSIEVTLVSPVDPGAPDRPLLDPAARMVHLNLAAKDENNDVDTSFSANLQVYAQFLGTLTPEFGAVPLTTIQMTNGVATDALVNLPSVFGQTVIWIDNGSEPGPDYVHGSIAGTSPTLFFPDPFIKDLQTPRDLMGLDALTATPLQDKQIKIDSSRNGPNGRLVVTSVFAQGYTVSDCLCGEGGAPPCTTGAFDHAMVFTFSAPRDGFGNDMVAGQVITGFAGGLSEFLGLTEVGFPQTFSADPVPDVDPARLPAPVVVDTATWFEGITDPNGIINFEKNEAAPIQVNNVKVCPLDEDFDTFKQWKLDPTPGGAGECSGDDLISVVSTGITGIDPAALVGSTLPRVVGVLRPLNFGGSGNIWLIFPRSIDDLTLP